MSNPFRPIPDKDDVPSGTISVPPVSPCSISLKSLAVVADFLERLGSDEIMECNTCESKDTRFQEIDIADEYEALREALKPFRSPLPLLAPVKNPALSADVRIPCELEVWKNHCGWNWHIKGSTWNLLSIPDRPFRSRSDAQRAAERTAERLNISICKTIVR
jgi:hypothetical protein